MGYVRKAVKAGIKVDAIVLRLHQGMQAVREIVDHGLCDIAGVHLKVEAVLVLG